MWGITKIVIMAEKSKADFGEKMQKKVLEINSLIFISLSVLESKTKKKIIQVLNEKMGENWLKEELKNPTIPIIKNEIEIIQRRKSLRFTTSDKLFPDEASMGFWVEMFSKEAYRDLKGIPIAAFSHRPSQVKRNDLYRLLKSVKDLRNEIVHYRVVFGSSVSKNLLQVKKLQDGDNDIKTLIGYLDPRLLRLLPKTTPKKIASLEKIISRG